MRGIVCPPVPSVSSDSVHPPPACDPLQHFAQKQMFADLSYAHHPHIVGQHQGVRVHVSVGGARVLVCIMCETWDMYLHSETV